MDPRLRAAVDTSLAWYADVFALHRLPTRVEDGLWWALGEPPPWHSGVKTTEPGVGTDRVLDVGPPGVSVADSFGDLDLAPYGFTVPVDATWLHHAAPASPASDLPPGWTVVGDPGLLAEWNHAHDNAGVLPPVVLDHAAFHVLARLSGGSLVGGAVVHRGDPRHDVVGLSNTWSAEEPGLDPTEVLGVVGALHPGAGVVDYAGGSERDELVASGYVPLGPQRVWTRPEPSSAGKNEGS